MDASVSGLGPKYPDLKVNTKNQSAKGSTITIKFSKGITTAELIHKVVPALQMEGMTYSYKEKGGKIVELKTQYPQYTSIDTQTRTAQELVQKYNTVKLAGQNVYNPKADILKDGTVVLRFTIPVKPDSGKRMHIANDIAIKFGVKNPINRGEGYNLNGNQCTIIIPPRDGQAKVAMEQLEKLGEQVTVSRQ